MPIIKLQHVVSCSSEDRNNPAENLLKPEGTHKWKSAKNGEKQVSAVIQFEKSSRIHSIDVGNEGSAFVEVLVGKSSASSDADYQVLLVASAFMSPLDSRNGNNRNAVRMFGADKLSKMALESKWDRVKVVCTQPFNKNTTYGLSFIKFHSPPDEAEVHKTPVQKKLGAFLIKTGDDDDDDIRVGTLFASRKKETTDNPPLGAAAAARAASKVAEESRRAFHDIKRNHGDSPAASASTSKPEHSPAVSKRKHEVSSEEEEDVPVAKPPLRKQNTSLSSISSAASKEETTPPLKKTKSEPPKKSEAKKFGELMDRVVFVLSGFQNPFRGELRDKALEMGAKYRPDWGRGCTHLICAFENTPKYAQVKGKGYIVTKNWISDCYKQKKLLPWRKYRLGRARSPELSSEEEEDIRPAPRKTPAKTSAATPESPPPTKKTPSRASTKKVAVKDPYGGDTDSGEDTEDEIRRVKAKAALDEAKKTDPAAAAGAEGDVYGDSTDEDKDDEDANQDATLPMDDNDDDDGADSGIPELPDFFADKTFFLYGDFASAERRLLTRYVTAYNGEMSDYMSDKVNYVVTSSKWDDNFDEALSENSSLIFVKPKWIHVCHDKGKLMPYQPYIVVPA